MDSSLRPTLGPPCCIITQREWVWLGCVSAFLLFIALATLKYLRDVSLSSQSIAKAQRQLEQAEQEKAIRAIPQRPVDVTQFSKYMEHRRRYPVLYRAEWQLLNKVENHSTRHASKPSNEIKNQNKKIIPYDYNRVVLEPLSSIPDTDYINASYIDSYLKPNAYIATQGPNEKTINDFWRLIWQERTPCIIMLTKTFDFIKVMCNQYWPNAVNQTEQYGLIQVTVEREEHLANYIIRNIRMVKQGEERHVRQYHYTGWPSHCEPYSNALLEFRRRIRTYIATISDPGPLIVHCSDGAGRTGVFLAVDANLELAEEDNVFDVFNYCKKLRSSRKNLIETIEQYKFIYETLEEYVLCGNSWFPVSELSQRMKYKSTKHGIKRMNEYQKEYQLMMKLSSKFTIGDCAGAHRLENRDKNRDVSVLPPDNCRPYLTSFQGNDFTDFINAIFVDGYTRTKEYIVTEWPMRHTVSDFWSLAYDYDCNSIVILCTPGPSVQYPSFWPETSKTRKYGPIFTIELVSSNHYPNVKTWIYRINKKLSRSVIVDENDPEDQEVVSLTELMAGVKADAKTVQLFHFQCWPMGHKVPTSTNALVELMSMVERWRQRSGYGPVLVVSSCNNNYHCQKEVKEDAVKSSDHEIHNGVLNHLHWNGRSRAGVYCAAAASIEQVIQNEEVDVFQAVRTVRRHRPQLVETMTEYKYCYDLVLHYVLHNLQKK